MNCPICKKKIDDDSKFCEFCGSKVQKNYSQSVDEVLENKQPSGKKEVFTKQAKGIALVLCILIIFTFLVATTYNLEIESFGISIPMTILVVFVYKKLAKKFEL